MGIDTTSLTSHSQNGKAPILHISLDRDFQNSKPSVHVRLGRAGVVGITKAILIGNQADQQHWFNAQFDLYADLGTTQAGVHMSRFSDALDEVMEEIVANTWPNIELLADYIAKTIIEKQKALRAEVHIRTTFPLERKTPVSGRPTQEVYHLIAQAVATRESYRHMIGVEVEGMVACPCAQDMVYEYARARLQEEGFPEDVIEKMLDVTPLATHNQRGKATLMIGTNHERRFASLVMCCQGSDVKHFLNYVFRERSEEHTSELQS